MPLKQFSDSDADLIFLTDKKIFFIRAVVLRRRGYCDHFVTMYMCMWVCILAR